MGMKEPRPAAAWHRECAQWFSLAIFQTVSEEVFSETQRAKGIKGQGFWNLGLLLVGLRLYSMPAQAPVIRWPLVDVVLW